MKSFYCLGPVTPDVDVRKYSAIATAAMIGNVNAQRDMGRLYRDIAYGRSEESGHSSGQSSVQEGRHSRRRFLQAGGAAALGVAAIRCGGGSSGGGGIVGPSNPTTYNISGYLRSTFDSDVMAPYKACLGSTNVCTSSDGRYAFEKITPGKHDLTMENPAAMLNTLKIKRVSSVNANGERTDLSQDVFGIPYDYQFDLHHNDQMCLGIGVSGAKVNTGTSRRFAPGIQNNVIIEKNYRKADGSIAPVPEYAIDRVLMAVDEINNGMIQGSMPAIMKNYVDKAPENDDGFLKASEGTIFTAFKDGPGSTGGPKIVNERIVVSCVHLAVGGTEVCYAVHELLHALGFDHVNNKSSIMWPSSLPDEPMQKDLDSFLWKYRRNPGAVVNAGEDRD